MLPPATIAVFGGTGRTGVPTINALLAEGYTVRAQARNPAAIRTEHENLVVLEGDYSNAQAVADVIEGSQAVIQLVGHVKGSAPTLLTEGMRHVIAGMRFYDIQRVINLTGAGVPYPQDHPKLTDRFFRLVMRVAFADLIKDATASSQLLRSSGLAYTNVRAPRLTEADPKGTLKTGYVGDISSSMTRADLANFLISVLRDDSHIHDEPAVSN